MRRREGKCVKSVRTHLLGALHHHVARFPASPERVAELALIKGHALRDFAGGDDVERVVD